MVERADTKTSPFRALLRFGVLNDPSELNALYAFLKKLPGAGSADEAEEDAQQIVFKLWPNSERAALLIGKLADQHPELARALELAPGGMPELDPAALIACEKQLHAYTRQVLNNLRNSRHRLLQRRPPTAIEAENHMGSIAFVSPSSIDLGQQVVTAAMEDPGCPSWFEASAIQVIRLAAGAIDMDTLTSGCVADDPTLAALAPEEARVRARNRLQQQHKRARIRLVTVIEQMVRDERLLPDEGEDAKRWLADLLRRRQNPAARAS